MFALKNTVYRWYRRPKGPVGTRVQAAAVVVAAALRVFLEAFGKLEIVVVHQIGKVGSKALIEGLSSANGVALFHTHRMNPEVRAQEWQQRRLRGFRDWSPPLAWGEALLVRHLCLRTRRKVTVVSALRDSDTRKVSSFFQNLDWYLSNAELAAARSGGMTAEALHRTFVDRFDHTVDDTWIEEELVSVFGAPSGVLRSIPTVTRASRTRNPLSTVVILRHSDLQADYAHLVKPSFPLASEVIPSKNTTAEKGYGSLPSEVLVLERLRSSRWTSDDPR